MWGPVKLFQSSTNWQVFREAATHEGRVDFASSVCGYTSRFIDDVTTTKVINTHTNQEPWLNRVVRSLLREQDSVFKSGDPVALRAPTRELEAAISVEKAAYAQRMQCDFATSDPRSM